MTSEPTGSGGAGRSIAFALVAQLLAADTEPLAGGEVIASLHRLLVQLDEQAAAVALAPGVGMVHAAEQLARTRIRWFEHGRLAPYEGSHVPANASGVTPRLADVAGFYRAFGMEVRGDRPDHIVAELEFISLALLQEDHAKAHGNQARAETCAVALRSFLRDHAGVWVDQWSSRLSAEPALTAWAPVALAAAELVRSEARRRNTVPVHAGT